MNPDQRERILALFRMAVRAAFLGGALVMWSAIIIAGTARADYAVDVYSGEVINMRPEVQKYRVTMYDAVETVTPGVTTYRIAPWSVEFSAGAAQTIYIQRTNSVSGSIFATTPLTTYTPNLAVWISAPELVESFPHSATLKFVRNVDGSVSYQGGIRNSVAETGPPTVSITRGGIIHQFEFDAGPQSRTALNLKHDGPFFVVVDRLVHTLTPDGGGAFSWEEEEELTSTTETVVAETTEVPPLDPNGMIAAPEVEVTSFDDLPPAERPAVVDSFQTLNQASEARHSDEKGLLQQIRDGVGGVKDAIAGLNAPGKDTYESGDTESETEAVDGVKAKFTSMFAKLNSIRDNFNSLGAATSLGIPTGAPQFQLELDLKGEHFTWESPPLMDTIFGIFRALLAAYVSFSSIVSALNIVRGAFADQPS